MRVRDTEATRQFLGGGGTVTYHSGDKSANVGRSHNTNATPLW